MIAVLEGENVVYITTGNCGQFAISLYTNVPYSQRMVLVS